MGEMLKTADWNHVMHPARMASIWRQLLFKKGSVEFTLVKLRSIPRYRAQTIPEYVEAFTKLGGGAVGSLQKDFQLLFPCPLKGQEFYLRYFVRTVRPNQVRKSEAP